MGCGRNRSIRFDESLDKKVRDYLNKNNIRLSTLISLAVEKFISETNRIELRPVESKDEKRSKN